MAYDARDDELDREIAKLHDAPTPKCAACGSTQLIPTAELTTSEGRLHVRVPADPEAILFKGWESQEVTVRLCGECGYAQFFVKNPGILHRVYQQSLKATNAKEQAE